MLAREQIRLPLRTQGTVTVSLAGESSEYRIPFGLGGGKDR
ncbi:hypothetical protein [Aeromonas jandaei]